MTLFISDTHLGNERCQADKLCRLLQQFPSKRIYLVGDIIDDHQMRVWPDSHRHALRLLFEREDVTYIPGNHDRVFRAITGLSIGSVSIERNTFFETGGKRYFVAHGDEYDLFSKLTHLVPRFLRRFEGFHNMMLRNNTFRAAAAMSAAFHGADGIICGHTHSPEIATIKGKHYINCGDWMYSCCAVLAKDGVFTFVS